MVDKSKFKARHTDGDVHKRKEDDITEDVLVDDTTGETIPSLMGWLSSEKQAERAKLLVEISDEMANLKTHKDAKHRQQ
jgi:hypothetical protein